MISCLQSINKKILSWPAGLNCALYLRTCLLRGTSNSYWNWDMLGGYYKRQKWKNLKYKTIGWCLILFKAYNSKRIRAYPWIKTNSVTKNRILEIQTVLKSLFYGELFEPFSGLIVLKVKKVKSKCRWAMSYLEL